MVSKEGYISVPAPPLLLTQPSPTCSSHLGPLSPPTALAWAVPSTGEVAVPHLSVCLSVCFLPRHQVSIPSNLLKALCPPPHPHTNLSSLHTGRVQISHLSITCLPARKQCGQLGTMAFSLKQRRAGAGACGCGGQGMTHT